MIKINFPKTQKFNLRHQQKFWQKFYFFGGEGVAPFCALKKKLKSHPLTPITPYIYFTILSVYKNWDFCKKLDLIIIKAYQASTTISQVLYQVTKICNNSAKIQKFVLIWLIHLDRTFAFDNTSPRNNWYKVLILHNDIWVTLRLPFI